MNNTAITQGDHAIENMDYKDIAEYMDSLLLFRKKGFTKEQIFEAIELLSELRKLNKKNKT